MKYIWTQSTGYWWADYSQVSGLKITRYVRQKKTINLSVIINRTVSYARNKTSAVKRVNNNNGELYRTKETIKNTTGMPLAAFVSSRPRFLEDAIWL